MHIDQLLAQIAAVMLLGRLLGRAVRGVGQPTVVAEIMAGILLGPSVLGAWWPDLMAWLFPPASLGALGTVAQLGLVFFMFLVGLEFDPRLLQGRARAAATISAAGILVPLVLGTALGVVLPADLSQPGVPRHAFALFVGVSMSVTAFPVLARILTERRLVRTPVGAMALAAAAVDDVTAWCLLALVVGISSAEGLGGALTTVSLALVYSGVVWFVVRPVLARLGPRQGHEVSLDVVTLALLVVVCSAFITERIGIHALFGGFLVGAAMPRHGGLSTVLAEKTEDFVTVVLLPLFFAYSGLRTQIGLVQGVADQLMVLMLLAVATLGKFGGSAVAARFAGLGLRESAAIGVLMNTRGLMEIVVLNVGLDLGVISPRMFTMMVIVAIVTTVLTTPLLRRIYNPAEPVAEETPTQVPRGLMICVADPHLAGPLVRLAAAVRGPDEPVWAVHLRPTDRPHHYLKQDHPDAVEPLDEVRRAAEALGLRCELLAFPSADPAEDIVRLAALKQVRLVVLGTHRSSWGTESLRGVAGGVLRQARAAVGILVDRGLGEVRRVRAEAAALAPLGEAFAGRVERAGSEVADLEVVTYSRQADLPGDTDTSLLLVRPPLLEDAETAALGGDR